MFIRDRLEAVFFLWPAGYGIEPQARRFLTFDRPVVSAAAAPIDDRRAVPEPRRNMLEKHVFGLDQVVVHADENHILQFQLNPQAAVTQKTDCDAIKKMT